MYKSIQDPDAEWAEIPKVMSEVKGRLSKDGMSKAFVFDKLEYNLESNQEIEINSCAQLGDDGDPTEKGIQFGLGRTVQAGKYVPDANFTDKKANIRKVWGRARIVDIVYLQAEMIPKVASPSAEANKSTKANSQDATSSAEKKKSKKATPKKKEKKPRAKKEKKEGMIGDKPEKKRKTAKEKREEKAEAKK